MAGRIARPCEEKWLGAHRVDLLLFLLPLCVLSSANQWGARLHSRHSRCLLTTERGTNRRRRRTSEKAREKTEEVSGKLARNNRCTVARGKAVSVGGVPAHHPRISERGFARTRNPIPLPLVMRTSCPRTSLVSDANRYPVDETYSCIDPVRCPPRPDGATLPRAGASVPRPAVRSVSDAAVGLRASWRPTVPFPGRPGTAEPVCRSDPLPHRFWYDASSRGR